LKKTIYFLLILVNVGCLQNQQTLENKTERIPYYNSPDFTPVWPVDKSQIDTIHSIPNFQFTNQNNRKVTQDNFKGKIHVMNCFFTVCPSLCPKIMGNMKAVQKAFKQDENVLIVSFSVMPDRDNVNVLHKYAAENQIIDNKWQLLTGDKKRIYQLARKGYFADENLGAQKGENDFLHSENFILVDKNLHIRGIYNGTLQLEIEQLIEDIKNLEAEE
jgi:protein SCO1/2